MPASVLEKALADVLPVTHMADICLSAYVLDPAGITLNPDQWSLPLDVRLLLPGLKAEALAIRRRWGCDTVTPYVSFPPYPIII